MAEYGRLPQGGERFEAKGVAGKEEAQGRLAVGSEVRLLGSPGDDENVSVGVGVGATNKEVVSRPPVGSVGWGVGGMRATTMS